MKCRGRLLLAILLYVALDLSLPAMPGAFVFEPAASVESIGTGRVAARVVVLPSLAASPLPRSSQLYRARPHRRPARGEVPPLACSLAPRLARAACDASRSAEDPH